MLRQRMSVCSILSFGFCLMVSSASAHAPLCSCYDNGDGTVLCDGGFSDGASASGTPIKVVGEDGKILINGQMNEASEFIFKKPDSPFKIIFEGGAGHNIEIKDSEISK